MTNLEKAKKIVKDIIISDYLGYPTIGEQEELSKIKLTKLEKRILDDYEEEVAFNFHEECRAIGI